MRPDHIQTPMHVLLCAWCCQDYNKNDELLVVYNVVFQHLLFYFIIYLYLNQTKRHSRQTH